MRCLRTIIAVSISVSTIPALLDAQTTEGLIRGQITTQANTPVTGAIVWLLSSLVSPAGSSLVTDSLIANSAEGIFKTESGVDGRFTFALLPPETYWLRVMPPMGSGLQPAEVHELIVPVAGSIEQPIELRSLNDAFEQDKLGQLPVPGSDQLVHFYGPDLDLSRIAYVKRWETDVRILEPSVSTVVDPVPIADLPFPGRDVFTMLALVPGVTSDSPTSLDFHG
jgi:hypothetical protein